MLGLSVIVTGSMLYSISIRCNRRSNRLAHGPFQMARSPESGFARSAQYGKTVNELIVPLTLNDSDSDPKPVLTLVRSTIPFEPMPAAPSPKPATVDGRPKPVDPEEIVTSPIFNCFVGARSISPKQTVEAGTLDPKSKHGVKPHTRLERTTYMLFEVAFMESSMFLAFINSNCLSRAWCY